VRHGEENDEEENRRDDEEEDGETRETTYRAELQAALLISFF